MPVILDHRSLTVRVALLSTVFDAPARAAVQNMMQFNGYHGCSTCKNRGKTEKTSKGGYKMTYPIVEEPLRTHQETLKEACQAELDGLSQQVVKGLSWLFRCPHFDIIRGVTIDYMHTICLGVVKTPLEKWILLKHKKETFSLVGVIDQLDAWLLAMTPPNKVGRLLRSVRDLGDWKASELRAFLLFYGVPCLQDLLPHSSICSTFPTLSEAFMSCFRKG